MAGAVAAMRKTGTILMGWAAAIVATAPNWLATITILRGESMHPTFEPDLREVALVDRRPRLDLRRDDVVIFRYDERKRVCSRLIALPGDRIKLSDTEEVRQVPEGHFWVEGDNSARSWDSRNYGPVPLDLMHGRVTRTIWPLHRFRPLHAKVSASQEARVIPTEMQKLCHTRKGFATISLRIST